MPWLLPSSNLQFPDSAKPDPKPMTRDLGEQGSGFLLHRVEDLRRMQQGQAQRDPEITD